MNEKRIPHLVVAIVALLGGNLLADEATLPKVVGIEHNTALDSWRGSGRDSDSQPSRGKGKSQFCARIPMKFKVFCLCLISLSSSLLAEGYKPELFRSLKLIYEDDFGAGSLDTNHWQIRQGTTWGVQDGVLVGGPSPKEFQEKKIAEGDKAHAGFKPVVWLEKVPENLVVQFRVRFDAEKYDAKFPLIDVGHHVNTLIFSENSTTLILKKDQKTIKTEETHLPLNKWADVTIELNKGTLILKINDKKSVFKDALIDMVDQQQIDFKGVDHGGISIDDVKVYEGMNVDEGKLPL